jgi:hypothetical protein
VRLLLLHLLLLLLLWRLDNLSQQRNTNKNVPNGLPYVLGQYSGAICWTSVGGCCARDLVCNADASPACRAVDSYVCCN